MNSSSKSKFALQLNTLAVRSAKRHRRAEQSKVVQAARQADRHFAEEILSIAGRATSVEDLVFLEKNLQDLDLLKAKTELDRKSILAARKSYDQFTVTLGLMRNNPNAYFTANKGHKESGGDPRAIVRGNSLDFIDGNVTRMRNREGFAPDGEREMWEARIAMAKKTADLFRDLHDSLLPDSEET